MSAATTSTIAVPAIAPIERPTTIIDAFDAAQRETSQRAAAEGRLEEAVDYPFAELMPRTSLVTVLGGALGFLTFMLAVPWTVSTYLARVHQATFQLAGYTFFLLVVVNLFAGYGVSLAHEWLHAITCRRLGGTPTIVPVGQYRFVWSANGQGFTRRSIAMVLLAPFVSITVLWLILLAAFPDIAAFFIAALTINMVLSVADLWPLVVALRQPATAVIFADRHPGFVAYAITAAKVAPKTAIKKTVTVPKKKTGK